MTKVKPGKNSVDGMSPAITKESEFEFRAKVYAIYDPLIKLFKVCGLFSARLADTGSPLNKLHFAYCVVLQVVVFVLSIRYFSVFRNDTSQLYTTIGLIGISYYYLTITVVSCVCFSSNWSHLPEFLAAIDNYEKKYGMSFDVPKTRKLHCMIIKIILGILVAITVLTTILMCFSLSGNNRLITSNFTPFDGQNGPIHPVVVIVLGASNLMNNVIVISVILFLLFNLRMFKLEFLYIRDRITEIIDKQQLENIGTLRLRHENIVELVEKGNPMFQHNAGLSYCYGIPIICLMLYGTTTRRFETGDIVAMTGIIVIAVLGISVITFMAAHMNEAAHSPLHDLFKADVYNESQKTVNQIQLFVSRLTGSPIGVSVYGLFVIDHSTILMVFGTIVSCAVIVVQFSVPLTCDCEHVNLTVT